MVVQVLDVENIAVEVFSGDTTQVSEGMFGGISINQVAEDGFFEAMDYLGLNLIRWPGGTLAENGGVDPVTGAVRTNRLPGDEAYFSLDASTHPELVNPLAVANGRETFSDMLAVAIDKGSTMSVVLPTQRYTENPSQVYSDVMAFLDRLYVAGDFNGGDVPPGLIFDVGNEYYDPSNYGVVAIEVIRAFDDFRDLNPTADFKVALPSMKNGADTKALIDVFEASPYPDLLAEVDIVRHHVLDLNLDQVAAIEDQSSRYYAIMRLGEAIEAAGGDLGGPALYFSAWTTESDDAIANNDQGLPAAGAMLSLFSGMVELGADYSAAWGIGAQLNNPTRMSYFNGGSNLYAPVGEVYRQMSESLVGTSLIAHAGLDDLRSESPGYNMFAYADDAKIVVFLSADDFTGSSLTVDLSLAGLYGDISYAWSESVTTTNGTSNGEAEVTRSAVAFAGTSVSYTFTQDYEVVRLIIARAQPGDGFLHLWGTDSAEVLLGGNSDDLLEGRDGNDTLRGGAGLDTLDGSFGNDRLEGGQDDDLLDGGEGDDSLYGGPSGNDTMMGGRGSDYLFGENDDDWMDAGDGFDLMNGGTGNDTLIGGNGNDRLLGNLDHDSLEGGAGDDILYGGPSGNDVLLGGAGNDQLFGEAGADILQGGSGSDTMRGGNGVDRLMGGAGDDEGDGGPGDDALYGGADGNDTLRGAQGNDFVAGEADDDWLFGDDGNDTLRGGAGDDRLDGGTGADLLSGQAGSDVFIFADGFGSATITDFEAENAAEQIDLTNVSAVLDFADLQANYLSQSGSDAVIALGGDTITLTNVLVADLDAGDFIF